MPVFLSQEWHDLAVSASTATPVRVGASARIAYNVAGGPDGDIAYFQVYVDGVLTEQTSGKCADADITMAVSRADAEAIHTGDLDTNTAFMQGRMKVVGDMKKLMALLPLTLGPEYRAVQEQVRAATTFA